MSLVELLTPKSCDVPKKRFGPNNDGGYVLLNKSFGEVAVFGYGVGHDATFEEQVAESLGCKAYVFDHTLGDNVPPLGPRTTFVAEGITSLPETEELKTFTNHLAKYVGPEGDVFLKIDVEGAEWGVIEYESFDRVTQLVIELHDLETDTERKIKLIQKITDKFDLVHIHGVNCHNQPVFSVDRATNIARYMECVFIRKGLVDTHKCAENYPTPFDMQSRLDAPDLKQDFWNNQVVPINFKIPAMYIPFIKSVMCACDSINGPEDGFNFIINETDAFPFQLISRLDAVLQLGGVANYAIQVFNKNMWNFEMRITHPSALHIGYLCLGRLDLDVPMFVDGSFALYKY